MWTVSGKIKLCDRKFHDNQKKNVLVKVTMVGGLNYLFCISDLVID